MVERSDMNRRTHTKGERKPHIVITLPSISSDKIFTRNFFPKNNATM